VLGTNPNSTRATPPGRWEVSVQSRPLHAWGETRTRTGLKHTPLYLYNEKSWTEEEQGGGGAKAR